MPANACSDRVCTNSLSRCESIIVSVILR
jgi:hypothetical protein